MLDENAVSFAQAEKLYYETSLISVGNELQSTQNEPGIICHYFMHMISCTQMSIMQGKRYTAMKILDGQELVEFFYRLSNFCPLEFAFTLTKDKESLDKLTPPVDR